MKIFNVARTLLIWLSISYVFSAAVFVALRQRGHDVRWRVIAGWFAAGVGGLLLSLWLRPGGVMAWTGLLVLLTPWMVHAFVGDCRGGHRVIALIDAAGISAIAWSLWVTRALAWH